MKMRDVLNNKFVSTLLGKIGAGTWGGEEKT